MKAILILLALGTAPMLSACSPAFVRAVPTLPQDEAITRPALAAARNPNAPPKVVLRVPVAGQAVTEQERKTAGQYDQAYNIIEKELLKAGFTVRDRALLSEVLRTNPNLDYKVIREKIDTDFIIEIVALAHHSFSTHDYDVVKDGTRHTSPHLFRLEGFRLEAKVVVVQTGEIGGIYTHFAPPQYGMKLEDRYYFYFKDDPAAPYFRTATAAGVEQPQYSSYGIQLPDAATHFARKLVADMRGK